MVSVRLVVTPKEDLYTGMDMLQTHKSIQWLLYVHYNDSAVGADGYKSVNFEPFSVAQCISIAIILYNL